MNKNKELIKIIPSLTAELCTKINLDGETYLIETEDLAGRSHTIRTRIHHRGKILSSREEDYKDILELPDFQVKLINLINAQQNRAIENLKLDLLEQRKTWKDYIKEIDFLIKINDEREALAVVNEGLKYYSDNPIIRSYQGRLESTVNKNFSDGIGLCKDAAKALKESISLGGRFYLPVLYFNLGKAYLAADQRRQAYSSFKKGLDLDNRNKDIFSELEKLGIRRALPFSFLKRSNPLNKSAGKLRHILTHE